jgi:hypothetical protein
MANPTIATLPSYSAMFLVWLFFIVVENLPNAFPVLFPHTFNPLITVSEAPIITGTTTMYYYYYY